MDKGVGMFENVDQTLMLMQDTDISKFECTKALIDNVDGSKFEILPLDADIFDKNRIVTPDSASEYSDYSKASSSNNGSFPGSKTKKIQDSDSDVRQIVLRKRKHISSPKSASKRNTPQPTSKPKKSSKKDGNVDQCDYCNEKGFLVCCDFCEASFHLNCHTPPIKTLPQGEFQCYRCYYKEYYEKHPVPAKSKGTLKWLKAFKTMRIVPYTLPDHVKAFFGEIPSLMPNDEFKRKFKRKKTDPFENCYVCNKPVSIRNSNQCQFCSNTIHLDCDPRPSCSTKLYAWRCELHVENYLDTYMLDSTSTYKRIKLWSEYAPKEIDEDAIERDFVNLMAKQTSDNQMLEAAKTMLDLKNSKPIQQPQKSQTIEFSQAERKMLLINKSMLYSDIFVNDSNAIAVFIPAFKTSTTPVVYDGRPLSFGTSNACTFNLNSLSLNCSNMCDKQLTIHQKQNVHYLSCGPNSNGYTRINDVFLMERAFNFTDLCKCIRPSADIQRSQTCSHIAVFPHKLYTIQLGCALFYLIFRPTQRINNNKPIQISR